VNVSVLNLEAHVPNLIRWWMYFEIEMMMFVPEIRRGEFEHAAEISSVFAANSSIMKHGDNNPEEWRDWYVKNRFAKYSAMNVKSGGEIVEFRIPEGTMRLSDMELWTHFFCRFVAASVLRKFGDDIDLSTFIEDPELVGMLQSRLN